jgi:murein L,D-transpeptidase YcbB/YkuD
VVLPNIKSNRDYLRTHNMEVLNSANEVVDPQTLNWSKLRGQNFPYLIRQRPGPQNQLGRVAFMPPNPHMVYLHDKPAGSRLNQSARALRSGCIRLERPLELAALLLGEGISWSLATLQDLVDLGQAQTLILEHPVPLLMVYWTAGVADDGRVLFRRDIERRDIPLLEALNASHGP